MRQIDLYVHEGCLSERSILLFARDIERACAAWSVRVHPLVEKDAKALGLTVLPAIAINGRVIASGMPKAEWLLDRIHEWEGSTR